MSLNICVLVKETSQYSPEKKGVRRHSDYCGFQVYLKVTTTEKKSDVFTKRGLLGTEAILCPLDETAHSHFVSAPGISVFHATFSFKIPVDIGSLCCPVLYRTPGFLILSVCP